MGEIATTESGHQLGAPSQSANLLAQIIEASRDPAVDAGKMQAMAGLAIQLQDREQQQQFNRDYNAAIMAMPVITKDGRIVIEKNGNVIQSTPFAKFEDLDRVVRPIARAHNLAYSFEAGGDKDRMTVRCVLRHVNGYVYPGEAMPLPLENSGSKNGTQGAGSTNTYGRRYTLQNAFAIVAEGADTDGHHPSDVVHLPHERELVVLQEAQAAHEAGRYAEHYATQSPRDRAWLVAKGYHAQFGGPALPAPDKPAQNGSHSPAQHDSGGEAPSGGQQAKRTPAQLVDTYVGRVNACESKEQLLQLQTDSRTFLTKVQNGSDSRLWDRIVDAHAVALDRMDG